MTSVDGRETDVGALVRISFGEFSPSPSPSSQSPSLEPSSTNGSVGEIGPKNLSYQAFVLGTSNLLLCQGFGPELSSMNGSVDEIGAKNPSYPTFVLGASTLLLCPRFWSRNDEFRVTTALGVFLVSSAFPRGR